MSNDFTTAILSEVLREDDHDVLAAVIANEALCAQLEAATILAMLTFFSPNAKLVSGVGM